MIALTITKDEKEILSVTCEDGIFCVKGSHLRWENYETPIYEYTTEDDLKVMGEIIRQLNGMYAVEVLRKALDWKENENANSQ